MVEAHGSDQSASGEIPFLPRPQLIKGLSSYHLHCCVATQQNDTASIAMEHVSLTMKLTARKSNGNQPRSAS